MIDDQQTSDLGRAMRRGLIGRCPRCATGKLFSGYLAVVSRCSVCGADLGQHRAADGPAFFTITLVGLLMIPILGFSFVTFRPGPVTLAVIVTVPIVILTFIILRLVKGAFVGYLWARQEIDRGS